MNFSISIVCPCECGQVVKASDAGFSATTVQVLPCAAVTAKDPAAAFYSIRKSEGMRLASLAMAPAFRAPGGLVVFA